MVLIRKNYKELPVAKRFFAAAPVQFSLKPALIIEKRKGLVRLHRVKTAFFAEETTT